MGVPPLLCLLILCAGALVLFLPTDQPTPTGTSGLFLTQVAAETARYLGRVEQAAASATALHGSQQASDRLTATALVVGRLDALTQQALTQAALPSVTVRPSPTATFDPNNVPPTRTPTPPAFVALTLIECRGQDGTVILDHGGGQSLHAHSRLSFTVPRGVHHLQVFWPSDPGQNMDTDLDLQRDTAIVFGDPC